MPDAATLQASPPPAPPATLEQLDEALKPKPLSPAAEEFHRKLEWRKIRNQVDNDPDVRVARAAANRAHTDVEKRKLLADYIELFTARAMAIAPPDMKNYANDRKREFLGVLAQPRVRPTAAARPTPTPKGKASSASSTPPPGAAPPLP